MKFISTRNQDYQVTFAEALLQNLPMDGGLFVPEYFPLVEGTQFSQTQTFAQVATEVLGKFITDPLLKKYCDEAFNFPVPLKTLKENTRELSLYEGPTSAFKDFGARFLAQALSQQKGPLLVATSGDTGGAVASAFWKHPGISVTIFFPHNKISKRQEHQLTCWDQNIKAYAVEGNFDDCQRIVKEHFQKHPGKFLSANSINLGRILPQIVYYAYSSVKNFISTGKKSIFYIPTGNSGNACAAIWAKAMGFPLHQIVMATNSNDTIYHYYKKGQYQPKESVSTLANAMDVGAPNNFERVLYYYKNDVEEFRKNVSVYQCDDDSIRKIIKAKPFSQIVCPHTATAYSALLNLQKSLDANDRYIHTVVATAHPAKFETIVEPLINESIPLPKELEQCLQRPSHFEVVSKDFTMRF